MQLIDLKKTKKRPFLQTLLLMGTKACMFGIVRLVFSCLQV